MLHVRTVYDALFSDIAGCNSDVIAVSKPTVAGLIQAADKKYGKKFGEALLDPDTAQLIPAVSVLANGRRLAIDDKLRDGDEVAFFPPVTGG